MRKKRICTILTQLLVLVSLIGAAAAGPQSFAAPTKIQAAFWGIKPVTQGDQQLQLLRNAGINTALVCDVGYQVKTELWRGWAQLAEKHAMQLMPVLCFAGTEEIKNLQGQYRRFTNRAGVVSRAAPCPLDETYWQTAIGQRFVQLARLSQDTAITGLVFDTEMYGGDLLFYDDACFCDVCWQQFLATMPAPPDNLPPAQRYAYLAQHQLFESYARFQENQLQQLLERLEQQIHRLNPELALGFLAYVDNWFYRTLIRGLGTVARPVLVFSETTYIRGYTAEMTQQQQIIKAQTTDRNGPPQALYIPGLWLGRFFPEDLPSQAYALATQSDGYWCFTADSFWITGEKKSPYDLHGSNEAYLTAFKQTAAELQRFAAAPAAYQTNFPPLYPASFYDAAQQRLFTPPSLPDFLQHRLPAKPNAPTEQAQIRYRAKTLFHALKNAADGLQTIQLTHVPVGAALDRTTYQLFDSNGGLLQQGSVGRDNLSVQLTIPAQVTGTVSLLTDSGANAATVACAGLPCVVEASAAFPVEFDNSTATFAAYVKPAQAALKLRTLGSATITVRSPDQAVNQTITVREFTETAIPVPGVQPALSQNAAAAPISDQLTLRFQAEPPPAQPRAATAQALPNFWLIQISTASAKPGETVRFSFYNAEFPYLRP